MSRGASPAQALARNSGPNREVVRDFAFVLRLVEREGVNGGSSEFLTAMGVVGCVLTLSYRARVSREGPARSLSMNTESIVNRLGTRTGESSARVDGLTSEYCEASALSGRIDSEDARRVSDLPGRNALLACVSMRPREGAPSNLLLGLPDVIKSFSSSLLPEIPSVHFSTAATSLA